MVLHWTYFDGGSKEGIWKETGTPKWNKGCPL